VQGREEKEGVLIVIEKILSLQLPQNTGLGAPSRPRKGCHRNSLKLRALPDVEKLARWLKPATPEPAGLPPLRLRLRCQPESRGRANARAITGENANAAGIRTDAIASGQRINTRLLRPAHTHGHKHAPTVASRHSPTPASKVQPPNGGCWPGSGQGPHKKKQRKEEKERNRNGKGKGKTRTRPGAGAGAGAGCKREVIQGLGRGGAMVISEYCR
jgi:hypothetical protein